jgi:hypothetical protein
MKGEVNIKTWWGKTFAVTTPVWMMVLVIGACELVSQIPVK